MQRYDLDFDDVVPVIAREFSPSLELFGIERVDHHCLNDEVRIVVPVVVNRGFVVNDELCRQVNVNRQGRYPLNQDVC